jgi:UDP-N-acetylglucosamine 3-dehydrogenase
MLKIGIVSYEHPHVLKYVPAFISHPKTEIAKICGIGANFEIAKREAEKIGCDFFDRMEEKFFDGLDAVYIASAPFRHQEIVNMAAENGLHILCDKPIALCLEEADEIIRTTERKGVKLMVPFNTRWQPAVRKAKELLQGTIHYVYALKFGMNPANLENFDTSWFFDRERAGFGGFGDIGMHMIDAIRFLVESDAISVYANINKDDYFGEAMIEFKSGALVYLVSGWTNPFGNAPWMKATLEILSDNRVVLINKPLYEPVGDFCVSKECTEFSDLGREDVISNVNEFVDCVIEDRAPVVTGSDARAALELVLASYRSAKSRDKIVLPLEKYFSFRK